MAVLVDLHSSLDADSALLQLWQQELLCDVALKPRDGPPILAHKVVLAASSGFFRALLVGAGAEMREGQQARGPHQQVDLPEAEHRWLGDIVGMLYKKQIEISWQSVEPLLALGSYLEVMPLMEACCQYIKGHLSLANCLESLALVSAYHCTDLKSELMEYVCSRFSQLMASSHRSTLLRLPPQLLQDILQADHLDVDTELEVAEVVVQWVAADPDSRQQYTQQLISAVRLPLLPAASTSALSASTSAYTSASDADSTGCSSLGTSPATSSSLFAELAGTSVGSMGLGERSGSWSEVVGSPGVGSLAGMAAVTSRKHLASGLIVAGGHDEDWRSMKLTERYDPLQDRWTLGPALPSGLSFAAAAAVDREVVVVGGTMFTASAMRLDPRQGVWRSCAQPPIPRIHSAATSLAGSVFVLGGRSQVQQVLPVVEQYRADTDTWSTVSSMLVPRYALGCAALGGRIYAVGGQAGRRLHTSVEFFDPEAQRWELLGSHLHTERKYTAMAAMGGRLYVVGGVDGGRVRRADVEALDPREGRWRALAPMSTPRSSCGVAALQDRLYVVGGNSGVDTTDNSVECFVPSMERWQRCASLSCGRSGLSVAAI